MALLHKVRQGTTNFRATFEVTVVCQIYNNDSLFKN